MLRKTVLARTLTLAFATLATSAVLVPNAMAQSNASGNIYGRIETPAGITVQMVNTDTGLKRTVTPGPDGRYNATAMPIGHYKIDMLKDGATVNTVEVDVLVGRGVEASFGNVQSVQVSGRRTRIDVSNANNGASFTAKELASLPIAQSVDAIVQLAPNATRADPRYAAGAPSAAAALPKMPTTSTASRSPIR